MTTAALVLDYITRMGDVRGFRVVRYMETMHKRAPGTTRNALWRLVAEGKIERVRRGVYRLGAGSVALEQYRPSWATGTKDADTLMNSIQQDRRAP